MKTILCEAIQTWKDNPNDGPSMGRRGFVTDGDHSYFREGVLNITCVFSTVTSIVDSSAIYLDIAPGYHPPPSPFPTYF